jgi:hypothetical protein
LLAFELAEQLLVLHFWPTFHFSAPQLQNFLPIGHPVQKAGLKMPRAHIFSQACHFDLDPDYRFLPALQFTKHLLHLLLEESKKVEILSVFGQK